MSMARPGFNREFKVSRMLLNSSPMPFCKSKAALMSLGKLNKSKCRTQERPDNSNPLLSLSAHQHMACIQVISLFDADNCKASSMTLKKVLCATWSIQPGSPMFSFSNLIASFHDSVSVRLAGEGSPGLEPPRHQPFELSRLTRNAHAALRSTTKVGNNHFKIF